MWRADAGTTPIDVGELRDVCRGMLSALDAEERAASTDVVHLGEGVRTAVDGTSTTYRFHVGTPLDASGGDPALLKLRHSELEVTVVRCEFGTLELTLEHDLGETIPAGGELLLDAPWLVRRLRSRVRECFEIGRLTPRVFNLSHALSTLGLRNIDVSPGEVTPKYENAKQPLNEEQAAAVERAFRSSLSVIAAPAGTGKSVTLGALTEAAYRAGLSVLVVAPSNAAVDVLMQQVCGRLENEPGFQYAEVLRIGTDVSATLRARYGNAVVLDDVVARLRPNLRTRLARRQQMVDALVHELTEARRDAIAAALEGGADPGADRRVRAARQRLDDARTELRTVQAEARAYSRQLIANARVVGTTLARAYLDRDLGTYDVVVIDEGSMAASPAVFAAAGLARRHVVIAGDPFQLAAPVRSRGPQADWLTRDTFARLDVTRAIRDEEDVPYLTQLTVQRRCAEPICDLMRSVWYGPRLRTASEVFTRERERHNVIFGTASVCYVDTSSLDPKAYRPWGRTFANDVHAALIADIVRYVDSGGELPDEDDGSAPHSAVLALSHYRGQVHLLRRSLAAYRERGVSVSTVHRAQGAEATTCILDLTLASNQRANASSIFTAMHPLDDGSRLLATAVSRARSRLILVGDFSWIERSVNPESVLGRVYSHLLEHGYRISVSEVRDTRTPPHRGPRSPSRLRVIR